MSKQDPAFLFYSRDFYEGTRMMLPEERACYIDLLIYQHQHGIIPDDLRRLMMYCSGCSEATLKATLEAKFKRVEKGYLNTRLSEAISERQKFKEKNSINGIYGQFWTRAKGLLNAKELTKLKKELADIDKKEIASVSNSVNYESKESFLNTLEGSLKRGLSIYANANANGDGNKKELDFEKIKSLFHQFCSDLPKIQSMSDSRKGVVKARHREYGFDKIQLVIEKTGKSDFLSGRIGSEWKANFDWIFKPTNFLKILEGNYDNKPKASKASYQNSSNVTIN